MAILLQNGESIQLQRVASHQHLLNYDGSLLAYVPPIGSLQSFYDYNGSLTFDVTKFAYCDGSNATFTGIGIQATPDLSARYLVGFGTDGGGDIDTSAWATSVVGAAGHQINLSHSHTVNAHSHTVASHIHSIGSHTHTSNPHLHSNNTSGYIATGGASRSFNTQSGGSLDLTSGGGSQGDHRHTMGNTNYSYTSIVNSTNLGNTGANAPATNTASPATNSALSATQSIQPRSIRVRWLVRIA